MKEHIVKIIRTSAYGVIEGDITDKMNTVKFGWTRKDFHPSEFVVMDSHHFTSDEVYMANCYAIKKIDRLFPIPVMQANDYSAAYTKVYETNIDASTNLLFRSLELADAGIVWHKEEDDI